MRNTRNFPPGTLRSEPPDGAIPISGRSDVASARCAGTCVGKRTGSCTERSDRWENGAGGTARPSCPPHARSKYAANPCCRTFRSARRPRSEWEPPRHKIANRSRGIARDAAASLLPGSPTRCAFGSGEDCRYDRRDISIWFTPGQFSKKNTRCFAVMASSICARLRCRVLDCVLVFLLR